MNGIIGFSELLKETPLDKHQNSQINIVIERSYHLLGIIDDIVDASRIESEQFELQEKAFNLKDVLNDLYCNCIADLKEDKRKNLKLKFEADSLEKDLVLINDPERLKQVLSKIALNAIKFTPKGSVCLSYFIDSKNYLNIKINDTGIGIEKEKQSVIFEKFRMADENHNRRYGGNGLGLSIANAIVKKMGGKITLESEPGEGSEFTVILPYKTIESKNLNNFKAREILKKINWENKKILIIEDDEISIKLYENILAETGAKMIVARDGLQGLKRFGEHSDTDLIILDIHLPLLNGYETSRNIRKINQEIPIIAISANLPYCKEFCFEAGCSDYIQKPINAYDLLLKMKHHLHQN